MFTLTQSGCSEIPMSEFKLKRSPSSKYDPNATAICSDNTKWCQNRTRDAMSPVAFITLTEGMP